MQRIFRVVAMLAVLSGTRGGYACSCVTVGDIGSAARLDESKHVLVAEVVSSDVDQPTVEMKDLPREYWSPRVVLRPVDVWKGDKLPRTLSAIVPWGGMSASCAYSFKVGERYLLFVSGQTVDGSGCDQPPDEARASVQINELNMLTGKGYKRRQHLTRSARARNRGPCR